MIAIPDLQWSTAKEIQTKNGPRMLRTAEPTPDFWESWRSNKDALKLLGVSCSRDERSGEWKICWWQELTAETKQERAASVEASRAVNAEIELPKPDGLDYMPFQRAGIRYALDRQNVLIADEMGLGKTVETIGIINADPAIASVVIVCPKSLKLNWKRELEKWLTRPLSIGVVNNSWLASDIVILNYEATGKFSEQLKAHEWDAVIVDECFVGNTLIETIEGSCQIKDLHPGMRVASFNFSSNAVEYKKILYVNHRPAPNILYKVAGNVSTGNHPYYTEESGYVKAKEICGKTVRALRSVIYNPVKGEEYRTFLFEEMRQYGKLVRQETSAQNVHGDMSGMREGVYSKGFWTQVLQYVLFCNLESKNHYPSSQKEPQHFSRKNFERIEKGSSRTSWVGKRIIEADERKQSNAQRRRARKNETITDRAYVFGAGRKRNDYEPTKETFERIRMERGLVRISNQDGFSKQEIQIASELLQGGHSQPETQISHRGRWQNSQTEKMEFSGQTKDGDFELFRVDGIEIYERGSGSEFEQVCSDGFVYNIEVEDNNNYFANGILVHNCHYIKNSKAQRSKNVKSIPSRRKIRLTGTPIVNRPIELYNIIEDLHNGFGSFFSFAKRYAGAHKNGFGWDFSGAQNLDELQKRLRETIMVRRLKKDVLTELPRKIRQIVEVEADTPAAKRAVKSEQTHESASEERLSNLRVSVELSKAESEDAYKSAVARLTEASQVDFTEMARLRHDTAMAKVPAVIAHITNALDDNDNKIIVAIHHHDVAAALMDGLAEFFPVILTGENSEQERTASVDSFQNDPKVRVFIGSITAAGVGITLTASSHVVFAELDWVPGNISQMEDRAHRIGQTETVLVQHIVLSDSLDARMANAIISKQNVIDNALDINHPERSAPVYEPKNKSASHGASVSEIEKIAETLSTEQCAMIHNQLRYLAGMDADHASSLNGIGFNKIDTQIGHDLAGREWLTPKQAALGIKICKKYHKQLIDWKA